MRDMRVNMNYAKISTFTVYSNLMYGASVYKYSESGTYLIGHVMGLLRGSMPSPGGGQW